MEWAWWLRETTMTNGPRSFLLHHPHFFGKWFPRIDLRGCVSLTLVDVSDTQFSVALIPHTLDVTTIGKLAVGDRVNLETDMHGQVRAASIGNRNFGQSRLTYMSQRQTLTYLSQRLQSVGIEPKTRFGQNFLIDLNLVELIALARS